MTTTAQLPSRQMIRLDLTTNTRLKRIAERETKRSMARVNPTDVIRKFIVEGCDRYEKEHPVAPTKGSAIR